MTVLADLIRGDSPPSGPSVSLQPVPAVDPWAEFTPASPRSTAADPWAEFTPAPKMGATEDVARSVPTGLAKGTSALVGLPGTIGGWWNKGADAALDFVSRKLGLPKEWVDETREAINKGRSVSAMRNLPDANDIQQGIESTAQSIGLQDVFAHKPQTTAGRYAQTVSEFAPGALAGPGGVAGNLIRYAAIPGVASEFAGQQVEGSWAEPYVRAGTAVVTGGLAGALSRPRTAEQVLQRELPAGLDRVMLDQAEQLILEARQRGISLTWGEALEQVAPGSGQGWLNVQRLLESSRDTRGQMGEFFAQRPGQVERAARPEFDAIAPVPQDPSMIGRGVGAAAERTVGDVEAAINQRTRPLYRQVETQRIDPQLYALIENDPVFIEGLKRVRNDKWIGPQLEHLPDDSVGIVDAVKKLLDETGENLRNPTSGTARSNYAANIIDDAKSNMVSAADLSTGSRRSQGIVGTYEQARATQAQMRQQYLEPLLKGPLGKIADRDITTRKAIDAMFPPNPLPNSDGEVATAMSALVSRNQWAARQLVRAHAEATFNQATKDLMAGPNQGGAAKFAASLVGNPQQRANLQAAVEALPNGQQTWQGFSKFLEIAQAIGKRQAVGSRTAFNASDLRDLAGGRMATEGAKAAVSAQRLVTGLGDAWDRWQLGRNLGDLANILTDQKAGNLLRAIANRPTGSREAQILAARLAGMFYVGMETRPDARANTE